MGMLYEVCPVCAGLAFVPVPDRPGIGMPCLMCKSLRVTETGLTVKQAEAAVERSQRYETALRRIASACGNPDPAEACRVVLAIVRETLEGKG